MRMPAFVRTAAGGRAVVSVAVLATTLVTGGWLLQRGSSVKTPSAYERARLFEEVRDHVSRYYVDSLDDELLFRKAVDGVLYELNDPYTRFLSGERLERLQETTSGSYAGVGVQADMRDGWVVVSGTAPGSPAERAGVTSGDRIIEIDGKSTEGWSIDEAGRALRGRPGTRVRLLVERIGAAEPFEIVLERSRVRIAAVRHASIVTPGVGLVDVKSFSDSTVDEIRAAIEKLRAEGMRSLVLDLRGNPGGLLEQGVHVAELFLDRGVAIVRTRARTPDGTRDYADQSAQRWATLPITVIVDERTASAAEIVAGALQDNDRAAIVGSPTFGKGSAQTVFRVGDGGLRLTTARWFTPVGRSINRVTPRESEFAPPDGEPEERPRFRSARGRTLFGGGGIVPDLIAGDTLPLPEEEAFAAALAARGTAFRDAVAGYALEVKRRRQVRTPAFSVTTEMLDALYERMARRGIDMPRSTFDAASPLVSRLLGYEIARYVFGADAEFQRRSADDDVLRRAVGVAAGARTVADVLRRAEDAAEAAESAAGPRSPG